MSLAYSETEYTYDVLNAMTKAQLLELATEYGIEGVSESQLKADMIAVILAYFEGAEGNG